MSDIVKELEELVRTPGISGFEDDIRDLIAKKIKGIRGAPKPRVDDLGNLIVTLGEKKKDAKHAVVIAHMDELGMLVTNINRDGSLSVRKVGGIDDRTLISRVVHIRTKKGTVPGIIGLKPPHLMDDRSEMKKTVPAKDLKIDVGTRSKKETETLGIDFLDPIVLKKDFEVMAKKYLVARALDDRFGCEAQLEMLRALAPKADRLPVKVSLVWSVQEEIGLRGAAAIANTLKPNFVFAIDCASTSDAPGASRENRPFVLGKGPGLRLVDNRSIASPTLRKLMNTVARKNRIPLQEAVTGGGTDAAAIQTAGCAAISVAIPLRYTHSTVECIHVDDLKNLIKLMVKTIEALD